VGLESQLSPIGESSIKIIYFRFFLILYHPGISGFFSRWLSPPTEGLPEHRSLPAIQIHWCFHVHNCCQTISFAFLNQVSDCGRAKSLQPSLPSPARTLCAPLYPRNYRALHQPNILLQNRLISITKLHIYAETLIDGESSCAFWLIYRWSATTQQGLFVIPPSKDLLFAILFWDLLP
jgi:hypothetical protein